MEYNQFAKQRAYQALKQIPNNEQIIYQQALYKYALSTWPNIKFDKLKFSLM